MGPDRNDIDHRYFFSIFSSKSHFMTVSHYREILVYFGPHQPH